MRLAIITHASPTNKKDRAPSDHGDSVAVTIRIPIALDEAIDAWAEQGISRSEAIRRLIEAGLKAAPVGGAKR